MDDKILLAHGSGGKLTHRLLKELVFHNFSNPILNKTEDAAIIRLKGKTAFTTDSFVIEPIFFPGGDIGKLAICGTVNDLAVMGANPLYLTAACIVEEGLEIKVFERIIKSMAKTAKTCGIKIVGGDLKVVEKNACDKIFINTTGLGLIPKKINLSASNAQPKDIIIINGFIGEHAAAISSIRQDYKLKTSIKSDCCALNHLIATCLAKSKNIHVMRDPTRGGVATTLNEIAQQSNVEIQIEESLLPVSESVRAFCEILGLDPLYLANEGKVLVFVAEKDSGKIIQAMQKHPLGKKARIIGSVKRKNTPQVILRTDIGSTRILDMLTGEQLPRIC